MKDIEIKTLLKVIGVILIVVLGSWLLINAWWIITLIIYSLLIVYVLNPLVSYLKNTRHLPNSWAVVIVFAIFLLLIFIAISLIVPIVNEQLREITNNFPLYVTKTQVYMQQFTEILDQFKFGPVEFGPPIKDALQMVPQNLEKIFEHVAGFSLTIFLGIVDLFFILFIVFYLLYDFDRVKENFLNLFTGSRRDSIKKIVKIVDDVLGGYVRGTIIRTFIVGLITGIGLFLMGMPYSLFLGTLAGLLNIILYIGPYIAAIPAVLMSLLPGTPSPVIVIIFYILVQLVDAFILAPILLGRALNLRPVSVIIALLIGGQLAGFLGVLIAVPIAGIIKLIIDEYKDRAALR